MKHIIYILSLSIAIILASCSSRDELAQYVPEDAAYTAKINAENLIKKSGCKLEGKQIILSEAIKKISKCKVTRVPDAFDFSKDVYVFGNKDFNVCLMFKVTDIEVLNNEVFEIGEFRESKGFKIANLNLKDRICVKDGIAFCVSPDLKQRLTDDQILDKIDELIANRNADNNSAKRLKGDEDLTFDIDINQATRNFSEFGLVKSFLNSLTFNVNFEKGAITLNVRSDINKSNPFLSKADEILTKCSNDGLKFFSKNINGFYGIGIDGEALKDSGLIDLLFSMQPMLRLFPVSEIVESINGSVLLGIHSTSGKFPDEIVAVIESKDSEKLLKNIVSTNERLFSADGEIYSLTIEPSFKLQTKDNYLVISNVNPTPEKSLKENSDLNKAIDGALIESYFSSEFINGGNRTLKNMNLNFDVYITVKSLEDSHATIKFRDSDTDNSLQYIIENSNEN